MADTFWTLEVGGVEKDLASWGVLLDFQALRQNKARHTVTLTTSEAFDPAATQWSYLGRAIIRKDRTFTGGVADADSGTVFFKGYFDDPRMVAEGESEN